VTCPKRPGVAITAMIAAALLVSQFTIAQTKQGTQPAKTKAQVQAIIKTQVRQVLFDVVVTDGKNRPITGLKREDFSVTENGVPQNILSFEAHTNTRRSPASTEPPLDLSNVPVNTFMNLSGAREDLPLNIILYDMLNTTVTDQPFAREEIKKFLMHKPQGSLYAIFVLAEKLHLLQGVTDDEVQLLAVMDSRAAGSQSITRGAPNPDAVSLSKALGDSGLIPNYAGAQAMLDRLRHLEGLGDSYALERRAELTLAAFSEIARFLRGVPGRKNLLWLSGSFPLGALPGQDPIDPFSRAVDFNSALEQASNQLTLSQVAVYPVDIRGVTNSSIYDSANNRQYSPSSLDEDRSQFMKQLAAEHNTMDEIAHFTGGHAFYETNGFEQALHVATEDGSNYYTLSYSPSDTKFDGRLRKIHVKVVRKGLRLSYRRSYFADDDSRLAQRKSQAPLERADAAMERGAPNDRELLFSVHAEAVGSPAAVTPEQIHDLSQFSPFANVKNWDSVKMQKYELEYALLKKQVTYLVATDGSRHANLEFLYAAYDADNNLLDNGVWRGDPTILVQHSDQAHAGVYRAKQILEIPATTSWLRIGVRDAVDARIGSLEIALPLRAE